MKNIIKIFNSNKGLTLVELIAAITIFMLVMGPITYLFYQSQNDYARESEKIRIQNDVNKSIGELVKDLRSVPQKSVKVGSDNIDLIENDSTKPDYPHYIIMRYPNDSDDNIQNSIGYKWDSSGKRLYRYKKSGNMSVGDMSSTGELILKDVDFCQITNDGNGTYAISVTVKPSSYINSRHIDEIKVETSFKTRF